MAEETQRPLEDLDSEYLFKKAAEPAPAEPEPVAAEAPAEPEAPAAPEPPKAPPAEPPEHQIPSWRLREEAEARRQAENHARTLEARLAEVNAHIQQTQKQPDFFENPDAATQALILRTLQPYAEEQRQAQMYNSRVVAGLRHGDDKVDEAEQAFMKARDQQSLDPADYERVVQSPNRYDAVVKWHKQQTAFATVGEDPEAWFQKRLEAAMDDPAIQAKFIERTQKGAASRPSVTKLPPTLSRTTAVASNTATPGDLSDHSLWSFATKR